MLCKNCGKNPAQKYVIKSDGRERQVFLCRACYEKLYGEADEADFFTSLMGGMGEAAEAACPVCGTTLEDFRATGLLGCAHCYTAFREEITPTVRRIQGKTRHEGKVPETAAGEKYELVRELVREQDRLKGELERAMRERDFSAAEKLKERLREINHKLYRGSGA